ncbi:putative acetylornithine aminotransferase [Phytophthora fragariae]|uniref:acetylornithine transaminase n=1 Tax=Phytophthora fragariae TaxID=53985 RepID=A0A6A3I7Z0_9STRA|nr:putative acetylornithine aminotransferase [Phytophthora fragariae]KAE8925204.1 putative acetylornithine aminotransferase [Phytophthora fragariae]KAE8979109.1 putative acetylornithine aminotransferase [Phytophthora fragariae]KAE9078453.1 putative acetylornithine aminotransferase [Phytophthora fragariae]KAE9095332.1 putative acetylornithine aminotransferase [Phytophthora fragariae]
MLSALRSAQKLQRATTGASRAFAAAAKPFNADSYEQKYLAKTYSPNGVRGEPGLVFTHGKGSKLYDEQGREFLDFYAGIAVSGLGHGDEDWYQSLVENGKKVTHVSNLFHSKAPLELAKTLVDNSCFDKVFFGNSGTEANEGAYKFARLYANRVSQGTPLEGKKFEFISFKHGFHGRTAAALTLTHKPKIREAFMPLVPGVHYAEFNDIESVKKLISDKTAGVIIEPIQGEGGLYPADPEFMRELRALCDKHDAMLIVDEVQCGLGRTGKLFAHELYDVTPDIMTLAKPLAGGLPIGAVLMSNKVASAITPGQHGTTFGGNPLVCAVANTVLNKIMDEDFLANVQKQGKYLADRLEKLQQKFPDKIVDVRKPIGKGGLFVALECSKPVGPLIQYALSKQVLIISAGDNTIRLCPPLVVDEKDIDNLLDVFEKAFDEDVL